ncbi:hypothetical protein FGO68_gene15139 [Halteria grandinella]|uniref:Uncharacterized protein n=1 Tax=Halteria grandinella TaxID=5974 RepID=A0A8J8NUV8_HALGN|nr:hypothetical protein FGO68_gene15139 [Halteria grandinella]
MAGLLLNLHEELIPVMQQIIIPFQILTLLHKKPESNFQTAINAVQICNQRMKELNFVDLNSNFNLNNFVMDLIRIFRHKLNKISFNYQRVMAIPQIKITNVPFDLPLPRLNSLLIANTKSDAIFSIKFFTRILNASTETLETLTLHHGLSLLQENWLFLNTSNYQLPHSEDAVINEDKITPMMEEISRLMNLREVTIDLKSFVFMKRSFLGGKSWSD